MKSSDTESSRTDALKARGKGLLLLNPTLFISLDRTLFLTRCQDYRPRSTKTYLSALDSKAIKVVETALQLLQSGVRKTCVRILRKEN